MRTLTIILLFFTACKQHKNDYVNAKNIQIDPNLTANKKELFHIHNASHHNPKEYSEYYVSMDGSFSKKSNDSLIVYLDLKEDSSNVIDTIMPPTEREHYWVSLILTSKGTIANVYKSSRHSTDEYKCLKSEIVLDKQVYQTNDSLVLDLKYFGQPKYYYKDSLYIFGKVKLQVKDAQYSYERLQQDNKLNQFLSEAKNSPDTIKYISLSNSGITKLPNELALFKNCIHLDLGFNNLSEANFSILENLQNLRTIDLSQCHLSKFPNAILKLQRLEVINISTNQLSDLPEDFYKLSNIKELNISDNKINYLSPKITNFKDLEIFDFDNTEIKKLPNFILKLKHFKHISPNCSMDFFPKELCKYLEYMYHFHSIGNFEEIKNYIPGYEE